MCLQIQGSKIDISRTDTFLIDSFPTHPQNSEEINIYNLINFRKDITNNQQNRG